MFLSKTLSSSHSASPARCANGYEQIHIVEGKEGGGDAMTPFSTEREKGLTMMMNAGVSPVMDEHPIQGE